MGNLGLVAAIVNPAARSGRATARWRKVAAALSEAGVEPRTEHTRYPGHARTLAANLAADGYVTILAVGGDGTVHDVVNGVFAAGKAEEVRLGLVPAGTGMDVARGLGLSRRPALVARQIAAGRELAIDVGQAVGADEQYFVNFAETGLGAAVVAREAGFNGAWPGRLSFLVAAVGAALDAGIGRARIAVDGVPAYEGPLVSVVVANGRYFGGGMRIAPRASPTDGLFDVLVLGNFTRAQLVGHIWKLYPGTHIRHPKVIWLRGSEVEVDPITPMSLDLDGELSGSGPYRFRLLPRALRVIV
jgi:YegS/Rv2252/BmrU family lipid kinase